MFTTTFYSYKGGVGRTSALMNVAHRLCQVGKKVCVLDFDLEAPGLDSFELSRRSPVSAGVVEYISSYLETDKLPSLSDFAYDITPKDEFGQIHLIPAGRKDAHYQYLLSRLDWKMLYSERSGFLVIEALRRAIDHEFKPDYLLVDSRTGLTDISGICTLQMPDLVVLLFNLNDQNIDGTSQVYRSIIDNKLSRAIQTLLVASPIPDLPESLKIRSNRFENAEAKIGAEPNLVLPYDPFLCFQESIVDELQSRALSTKYQALTNLIIARNEKDVTNLLERARATRENGQIDQANIEYQEIVQLYPDSGEVWFDYGVHLRIVRQLKKAADCFRKAAKHRETHEIALAELSTTLLQLRQVSEAERVFDSLIDISDDSNVLLMVAEAFADEGHFESAAKALKRAIGLDPEERQSLSLLGQVFAGMKSYDEAFSVFMRLHRITPTSLSAVFNAGAMAFFTNRREATGLLKRAIELFEASRSKI